jgi:hypothetical protein
VVSFRYIRTRAFDDHAFYTDFVGAMHRLAAQRPFLDDRKRWSLALEYADEQDNARWVAAQNARDDGESYSEYFATQRITVLPTLDEPAPHQRIRAAGFIGLLQSSHSPAAVVRKGHDIVSARNEPYQKRERDYRDYAPG